MDYGPIVLDHISLQVTDVATSVAFYERVFGPAGLRTIMQFPGKDAVDAGAEILHGPRVFAEYHPSYYGVFLRDPDDNNVEAVHHC